nr:MAG: terminase large subunit [Caudoviricetes sp.]
MPDAPDLIADLRLPRPDRAPIYDWARRNVQLPESYATPGPFNVRLSPWLVPIFDALQDPLVRRVHFRKAVQIGGTLVADVWLPWIIANDPGPISWTMQTDEMVEKHAKTRLWPLLERCRPVAAMLPKPGPHRTTTEIYFGGFFLTLNAANLSTQQSQSIRYKINDELWLPRWQEIYGHAVARVSKFEEVGRSKIYNSSQAPVMDAETGNVEDASFRSGDQGEWHAECPACRKLHAIAFEQLTETKDRGGVVWDKAARRDDDTWDVARVVETVRFRCVHCGHESLDNDATRAHWAKTGRYVPQNPKASREVRSFRIEALVTRPMRLLAEEWAHAENAWVRTGDESAKIEFRTKREARPWIVEKKSVNLLVKDSGYKVADHADGQPIPDEAIRFLAIDRQQDHFWAEVGAFSTAQGPRYRQLWFGRVDTRDQLRQLQQRYKVADACVAQDRGYRPADVDRDCAEFGWRSMRGYGRRTWTMRDEGTGQMINFPFSDPQVSDYRGGDVYFYNWSGDYFKDLLAAALEGKGDLRWEMPSDVNPLYIEHLKGEHKVEVRTGVWEWREVRSNAPNHGLDTSAMLLCMATIAGVIRYAASKP